MLGGCADLYNRTSINLFGRLVEHSIHRTKVFSGNADKR